MSRLLLVIVVALGLLGLAYLAHAKFGYTWTDALTVAGLVGGAATVVAVLPARRPAGRIEVSRAYLTVTDERKWTRIRFEATVLNLSAEQDILREVKYAFYQRSSKETIPLMLVFGAKEVGAAMGHILPITLEPSGTYLVEASDSVSSDSPWGRLIESAPWEDLVLHCLFISARARPLSLYVQPFSLERVSP